MNRSLRDRFYAKFIPVTESGCWLWIGGITSKSGYGKLNLSNRYSPVKLAHRISYELHIGAIPYGLDVLHRCDVPCCVNPDHLVAGTHGDNMRDMARKGRADRKNKLKSYACSWSKFTPEQIRNIRSDTRMQQILADEFGVSQSCISNIKNLKTYQS
jgi:hypothetical protein